MALPMSFSCSATSTSTSFNFNFKFKFKFKSTSTSYSSFSPLFSASFPIPNSTFTTTSSLPAPAPPLCPAASSQNHNHNHNHNHNNNKTKPRSSSSSSSSSTTKKKKKNNNIINNNNNNRGDFEIVQDFPAAVVDIIQNNQNEAESDIATDYYYSSSSSLRSSNHPNPNPNPNSMALPEPPAGFILDDHRNLLFASPHRLLTIVDPTNNLPLECVVRRVFSTSEGHQCMLLSPVDTPVQILKNTNEDGWSAVSDKEVESILPAAAYALAKIHMHLVYSGYCYTARGGFCYTEEDIFDFTTDDGKEVDGLPTEGVEITYFNQEDTRYMIYTPSDPLLFVGVKDQNGMLQVADDELLEDPAIYDAIDEETEFNALAEEEAALLDLTLSERL